MPRRKALASFTSFFVVLLMWAGSTHAGDISGTISSTLTIVEDSRLVGLTPGSATFTPTGAPPSAAAHFNIVVDPKGAGFFFIQTDPGNVVRGQVIRLDEDHEE